MSEYKPAVTETGLKVMVPRFVEVGDTIIVDTRTGEYVGRQKKEKPKPSK